MTIHRWTLDVDGHAHLVEIDTSGWRRSIRWRVDDQEVAAVRSGDDRVRVAAGPASPAGFGVLALRFGAIGPARRVTLHRGEAAEAAALVGTGGVDLEPEPGSAAARRRAWIAAHPRLHTTRATLVAATAVVLPLLLLALLARLVPAIPWPDWNLPHIPWPDLPDIPWPDLPDVVWPSLPSLPGWVREVVEKAKYVVPVLVAFALARAEIRRHRKQASARGADDRSAGEGGRRAGSCTG